MPVDEPSAQPGCTCTPCHRILDDTGEVNASPCGLGFSLLTVECKCINERLFMLSGLRHNTRLADAEIYLFEAGGQRISTLASGFQPLLGTAL